MTQILLHSVIIIFFGQLFSNSFKMLMIHCRSASKNDYFFIHLNIYPNPLTLSLLLKEGFITRSIFQNINMWKF